MDMTSEQSSQRYTFCHHSSGHEPLAHVWKNSIAFNPMYSRHHRCGALPPRCSGCHSFPAAAHAYPAMAAQALPVASTKVPFVLQGH